MKKDPIKIFREYFEGMVERCLDYVKTEKKKGRLLAGIFCEYAPREMLMAADFIPVCMCGGSQEMIPPAEADLPVNLCPIIKSSYGFAKTKENPFFEMADLVVGETTCDGKKKMFELLSPMKEVFVLELPQNSVTKNNFIAWKNEFIRFKNELEKISGKKITAGKLRAAIKKMNRERALLREIAGLMKNEAPSLTGADVRLARSLISCIPEDLKIYGRLIKTMRELQKQPASKSGKVRILLTGVPVPHGTESILSLIEDSGGLIVSQESCTGIKPVYSDVKLGGSPITALAEKYLALPCSCMTPNRERLSLLDRLISEYSVEAVIELVWRACHTYNIEAGLIKNHVKEIHGLPYLKIETDFSGQDSGQLKTRIQALLEISKKN